MSDYIYCAIDETTSYVPRYLAGFLKQRICLIIPVTSEMGRLRKTLTYLLKGTTTELLVLKNW